MRLFAAMAGILFALSTRRALAQDGADGYEYVYEDEEITDGYEYIYEDDVAAATSAEMNMQGGARVAEQSKEPAFRGYYTNVGGGIIKIHKKLVDEIYINETAEYYDCVKRVDSGILALDIIEDEEESEEEVLQTQIKDLRKKLDEVTAAAANGGMSEEQTLEQENITETLKQTELKASVKKNQMTFREKQAMKMAMRLEVELEKEAKRPKFRLGADCETMVCGSCKAVVEEFAHLVHEKIDDPNIRYIEELTKDMCKSKRIQVTYVNMMTDICENFEVDALGYKETLIKPFEEDGDWDNINKFPSINAKQKEVCLGIGACTEEQFVFQTEPIFKVQEHWDKKCFVCQAFANDLEERMQLQKYLTESSIVPVVRSACDRLGLPSPYAEICEPLVNGARLDDIAWLAKVHAETVARKAKGELRWADKLCEEINYCEKWMEPEKFEEKLAVKNMDMVFF